MPIFEPIISHQKCLKEYNKTMAEATTIIEPRPTHSEESLSSSIDTSIAISISAPGDTKSVALQNEMSIETTLNKKDSSQNLSSFTTSESSVVTEAPKDDQESSPRALQNLVLAAASDLLDVSPRSMLMETPTSQVGTPYSERKAKLHTTTPSTTPKEENSKPKGILRKPKYTVTVPINLEGTDGLSPTTGNTINNMNQYRKNRSEFDFDFSEIDRMVDDDDDYYNIENSGNTTLLSMLWSLVVLPIVLLGYGGLPYLVLATLVWTLIFVARWFRRFLVEEFSMRRNGSLQDSNGNPIPASVGSPFANVTSTSGKANLSGILASISPIAGARSTKVRFQKGIKFPERKLLRQPIPRIQKPKTKNVRNNHKKPSSLFFGSPDEETNSDGDTWSLDSLIVLRNYMKDDSTSSSINDDNGPTPMSVMAPPPPYPPTLSDEEEAGLQYRSINSPTKTRIDDGHFSGNEADDEGNEDEEEDDEDASENDEVPELPSTDRLRRDSFFPQEVVEEEDKAYESRYGHSAIQLEMDDENDEPIDDYFHEGLFGKSDSSSPTADGKRKKTSRYRRRKPRDSLCFTFAKKTVVPEGPSIPQCPSDEQEFLQQKIQEKFEQAIVIEAPTEAASDVKEDEIETSEAAATAEDTMEESARAETETSNEPPHDIGREIENEDDDASSDHESLTEPEEEENDVDATTSSLTTGSWDAEDSCQQPEILSPNVSVEDENSLESDTIATTNTVEEEHIDVPPKLYDHSEEEMSDVESLPDLDEEVKAALRETEELLASFTGSTNIVEHLDLISDEDSAEEFTSNGQTALKPTVDISPSEATIPSDDEVAALPNFSEFEEEPAIASDMDDVMPLMEFVEPIVKEETVSMPIVNDLQILEDDEASKSINVDLLSADKQGIPKSDSLTEQTEPEELSLGTEGEPRTLNEEASASSDSQIHQLNDLPEEEDVMSTHYAEEDLVMDDTHYSTIIHEALKQNDSEDLPILEDDMSASGDDFPDFNVMQEISFDNGSDDVECILSPHAFKFEDEDTMFRARDPLAHIPFTKTERTTFVASDKGTPNNMIIRELHTTPSDLQIEMAVSDVDVECMLSPMQPNDTDSNSFESEDESEEESVVPPPPKSPENKENSKAKMNQFFVDTAAPTKRVENTNIPWSPAFPRTVLSPANQQPARS